MRTTVNLGEDMYILAQQTAAREEMTLGEAITQWMRRGTQAVLPVCAQTLPASDANPYVIYPKRSGAVISSQDVYRLMEEEGI